MLVLNFPAFENKKYTAYDRFHGNGPYGKIPTKKEPIRTLGFALPYNNNCFSINLLVVQNFHLNPLHRHFKNTKKRPPTHAPTLLTIYHRLLKTGSLYNAIPAFWLA